MGSSTLGTKELFDAVLRAVQEQDIETLKQRREEFIAHEENFAHCVDMNGNTVLHKAAIHTDTETLITCVEQLGCDTHLNHKNTLGKTALHEAAKMNLVNCVEYLLSKGADLVADSHTGSTPFHTACAAGSVEVMECMLAHAEREGGAEHGEERKHEIVNAGEEGQGHKFGCCPIHKCAFDGNTRVLHVLLENGANIDATDRLDCNAAHIAVKMNQLEFIRMLMRWQKAPKEGDTQGKTRKLDINAGDMHGSTPLHYAVARCYHAMVRELIQPGAKSDDEVIAGRREGKDGNWYTREEWSANGEFTDAEWDTAPQGANINQVNEDGNTPLHIAAQNFQSDSREWEDLVLDMLRMGADHEAKNNPVQRTPASYVPRNVQFLFEPKEFRKRDAEKNRKMESQRTAQQELEEKKRLFKEQIRETHKEREKMRKEVMEERRREEEERQRREDEEAKKREEEEEERRKEEEEKNKKKKGSKKKD